MIEKLFKIIGWRGFIYFTAGLSVGYAVFRNINEKQSIDGKKNAKNVKKPNVNRRKFKKFRIFFASETGKSKKLALLLLKECEQRQIDVEVIDLKGFDPEGKLDFELKDLNIFITSTHTWGKPPEGCEWFFTYLDDASHDFRVSKTQLSKLNYTIVSLGNSCYSEHFAQVGKKLDENLEHLGASRVLTNFIIDDHKEDVEKKFAEWMKNVLMVNEDEVQLKNSIAFERNDLKQNSTTKCGSDCACIKEGNEAINKQENNKNKEEEDDEDEDDYDEEEEEDGGNVMLEELIDVEDIGVMFEKPSSESVQLKKVVVSSAGMQL